MDSANGPTSHSVPLMLIPNPVHPGHSWWKSQDLPLYQRHSSASCLSNCATVSKQHMQVSLPQVNIPCHSSHSSSVTPSSLTHTSTHSSLSDLFSPIFVFSVPDHRCVNSSTARPFHLHDSQSPTCSRCYSSWPSFLVSLMQISVSILVLFHPLPYIPHRCKYFFQKSLKSLFTCG